MNAQFWTPAPQPPHAVRCTLCRHACLILDGRRGLCGVRENRDGTLYSLSSDAVIAAHVDPVEKKPLYHVLPGTRTFSIGSMGCNFACVFCQNADISRTPARTGQVRGQAVSPAEVVDAALRADCASIAFTYNEPTVFAELLMATADCAASAGLARLLVSNGFQSAEFLAALNGRIDAANIDLKSFREDFYRTRCQARLAPVLDNLKQMVASGWHVEVTTLIIPGLNDSVDEWRDMARFIRDELGPGTPWHLSAFRPCFELTDRPPTPPETIQLACATALAEGLFFVYPGNVPLSRATRCPHCGAVCLERQGWQAIARNGFAQGRCGRCQTALPGLWR